MRKRVGKELAKCELCAKNKIARHSPYGKMEPIISNEGPWETVTMDFIVKLPESKDMVTREPFDSILVITDKLTKYGYFIPYKEATNAEQMAYTFMRNVVANHGMPKRVITDRDKLFKSKFWKSLMNQLGVKQKMTTAYHPQANGQTERLNQTLEQYLRNYVGYLQDDWVTLLPTAQFAYNSAITEPTGYSPFYANYGFNPTAYNEERKDEIRNATAQERAK